MGIATKHDKGTSRREAELSVLRLEAQRRDVPAATIDSAIAATRRWHAHLEEPPTRGRMRTYFWGVVRRRAFSRTSGDSAALRRRFILASVAADLRSAGLDEERVAEELRLCFGSTAAMVAVA